MLRAIRWLLLVLNAGNWLFVLFALTLIAMLALNVGPFPAHLRRAALPGQEAAAAHGFMLMALIGVAVAVAVDIIFRRLLAMIATVAARTPFAAANADRLRHIAWALLAIQLLDLAFGALLFHLGPLVRRPAPSWSPALTGWLAVLLLFVLARVFRQGAEMQDEIEATV